MLNFLFGCHWYRSWLILYLQRFGPLKLQYAVMSFPSVLFMQSVLRIYPARCFAVHSSQILLANLAVAIRQHTPVIVTHLNRTTGRVTCIRCRSFGDFLTQLTENHLGLLPFPSESLLLQIDPDLILDALQRQHFIFIVAPIRIVHQAAEDYAFFLMLQLLKLFRVFHHYYLEF